MRILLRLVFLSILLQSQMAHSQVPLLESVTLTPDNTVVLRGEVNYRSMQDTQNRLADLDAKRGLLTYPIYLVLDSPGGSIAAGQNFIEYAKTIKNVKTITLFSASMAAGIVQALPGERLITNHGIMMFHRASGSFSGQFEMGELERRLFMAKSLVLNMENINSRRMGMSLHDYKRIIKDELWLVGAQSLRYRAADRQVDIRCSKSLIREREKMVIDTGFVSVSVSFSKCPLFRLPEADPYRAYRVPVVLD